VLTHVVVAYGGGGASGGGGGYLLQVAAFRPRAQHWQLITISLLLFRVITQIMLPLHLVALAAGARLASALMKRRRPAQDRAPSGRDLPARSARIN